MVPFSVVLKVKDATPFCIQDSRIGSNSNFSDVMSGEKNTWKVVGCSGVPSNWIKLIVMVAILLLFTLRTGGEMCSLSAEWGMWTKHASISHDQESCSNSVVYSYEHEFKEKVLSDNAFLKQPSTLHHVLPWLHPATQVLPLYEEVLAR